MMLGCTRPISAPGWQLNVGRADCTDPNCACKRPPKTELETLRDERAELEALRAERDAEERERRERWAELDRQRDARAPSVGWDPEPDL